MYDQTKKKQKQISLVFPPSRLSINQMLSFCKCVVSFSFRVKRLCGGAREMDTSDKKQITVASVSKFEDSPVFNYISSLSPIEQIKSIRNDRSFNSVNFTSPSSLFASPKIGYRRESRFSRCSTQSPDILKPELPLHGKENKKSKGNSEAVQLSDDCTGKLDCVTPGSSARELRICNMGSSVLFPATSVTGVTWSRVQVKDPRFRVRASLDTNVSDMSVNEPEHYRGPKLKVAIIGAGLAGMSTAVELLDQGHEVDIYELRSFIGGKVASFVGKHGNHIEISLHIFFGCCNNLFRLTKKVGADENLLMKDHTHKFVNKGGEIGELDFRFPIGAPLHGIRAFLSTNQLKISFSDWFLSKGGTWMSIQRICSRVLRMFI